MAIDPKRVQAAFLEVVTAAPDERDRILARVCAGDAELRRRVESLLGAHDDSGELPVAGTGAFEPGTSAAPSPTELQTGVLFADRYKLREKLGEGGMGVVWVADQTEPVQRRVALKVIKAAGDSGRLLARFEQERQALALMDHPNIAKVFDAGIADENAHGQPPAGVGVPYFVMELIKGVPITKYCDEAKLTPKQRLELFIPVCQAVQHAHQKGIIHRDLKPSNILIGLYDGRPVAKVIDFGVAKATGAKLTDQSVYTEVGSLIGTLEYMSPEQAELNNLDIDTRSDIYALGVVLYELLTGTVPHSRKELRSAGFAEMLRIIKEVEPPKPSTRLSGSGSLPSIAASRHTEPKKLTTLLRNDLDWIVMKALEKDRSRRYETANGFAMDIQRYLADEPVLAGPPSAGYRLRKFVKRNKAQVVAGLLVLCSLSAGVVGTSIALVLAEQARSAEADRVKERDAALDKVAQALKEEAKARAAEKEQFQRYRNTMNFAVNELRKPIASAIYTTYAQEEFSRLLKKFIDQAAQTDNKEVTDRVRLTLLLREIDGSRALPGANADVIRAKYQEAIALAKKMEAAETRDFDLASSNVAVCYSELGAFELSTRQFEASYEWYSRALAVYKQLLESPRTSEYTVTQRKGLFASSLNALGYASFLLGRPEEAIKLCNRSLSLFEEILASDRNAENLAKLADIHFRLGTIYQNNKEPGSSLAHLEKAVSLQREMRNLEPKNLAFKLDLAKALGRLGDAYFFAGKLADARKTYDGSVVLSRELSAPAELLAIRRSLALTLYKTATAALRLGDRSSSIKTFDECLAIREEYSHANPTNFSASIELMLILARCGKVAEARIKAENLLKVAAAQKMGNPSVALWQLMSCFAFSICADNLDRFKPIMEWSVDQLGERKKLLDRSIEALELAVGNGFKDHFMLETDPDADGLRGDPRFAAIIEKLKISQGKK